MKRDGYIRTISNNKNGVYRLNLRPFNYFEFKEQLKDTLKQINDKKDDASADKKEEKVDKTLPVIDEEHTVDFRSVEQIYDDYYSEKTIKINTQEEFFKGDGDSTTVNSVFEDFDINLDHDKNRNEEWDIM